MLIKLGSIITDASGSLAGHTIQSSKGGMQLRSKPITRSRPSSSQYAIRSYNSALQQGWKDLTDVQRSLWNDYAPARLCGHDIWMSYQYAFISQGFHFQTDPSKAALGPLGPELIENGTFDTSDFWTIVSGWSISSGKANYLDSSTQRIYQSCSVSNGKPYQIQFDISGVSNPARLAFYNVSGSPLFSAPYNSYTVLYSGHYKWNVVCVLDSISVAMWGLTAGTTFSIDNLSLKLLYQ